MEASQFTEGWRDTGTGPLRPAVARASALPDFARWGLTVADREVVIDYMASALRNAASGLAYRVEGLPSDSDGGSDRLRSALTSARRVEALATAFSNLLQFRRSDTERNDFAGFSLTAGDREVVMDYMASELRNAASGLVYWVGELQSASVDAREAVVFTLGGARLLEALAGGLSGVMQLRNSVAELRNSPIRLQVAAAAPVRMAESIALARGAVVEAYIPAGLPPISADEQVLQGVLLGLICFALAWPEGADVERRVSVRANIGMNCAIMTTEWSGDEIPSRVRRDVFDPRVQAAIWRDSGRRSGGLSLTFCQEGINAMGGRIWVDSPNRIACVLPTVVPVDERT